MKCVLAVNRASRWGKTASRDCTCDSEKSTIPCVRRGSRFINITYCSILLIWRKTSSLDTQTEQALLRNINNILKEYGRTSIFIAHRLRTIVDSDRIFVLKDGCVRETGSHKQLLAGNGLYSELWNGESSSLLRSTETCHYLALLTSP